MVLSKIFRIVFLVLGLWTLLSCNSNRQKINVAILCSYEAGEDSSFVEKLKDEFVEKGYDADIRPFYLRSHYMSLSEGYRRLGRYLDALSVSKPDFLIVKDDPAFVTLLSSGHSKLKDYNIFFTGVNNPDWNLLSHFGSNVRGFWNRPSYDENIALIQKLYGKVSIELDFDTITLPQKSLADAVAIANSANIDVDSSFFDVGVFKGILPPTNQNNLKRSVLRVVPYNMLNGPDIIRYLHQYAESNTNFFLIDRSDNTTQELCDGIDRPVFTTLNNHFGKDVNVIGGYFSTLEMQVEELVDLALSVYLGKNNSTHRYIPSSKAYVFDSKYLKKWNVDKSKLPVDSIIVGESFSEKHFVLLLFLEIAGVVVLVILSVYIFVSIRTVRKEKELNLEIEAGLEQMVLSLGNSRSIPWTKINGKYYTDSKSKELYNLPSTELSSEYMFKHIHPDDLQNQLPENYVLENNVKNAILRFRFRIDENSEYQWYETHYSVIENAKGNRFISGLAINIDSHIRRQDEIKRTSELVKKSLSKNSFFDSIIHEIRTPLNAIMGFTDILVSDEAEMFDEATRQQMISEVNVNNERLLAIINNILEISRVDSGKKVLDVRAYEINEVLEFSYNDNIGRVDSSKEFVLIPCVDICKVNVDRDCFSSIIMQLVTNANKFSTEGKIKMGAYLDSDRCIVYVEDSGCGISKDEQKVIFERFYKVNPSSQGTGLGLSLALAYTEKFNGTINVISELGKGSRFEISLPCT